jgi:formylglycine-generating enzyme required for sulfatase activity
MGKYEVTQQQYREVMGNIPPYCHGGDSIPVYQVNWHDAMSFCQKLSDKTGQHYTLPTEAQWEYACRAGTQTVYYFGNDYRNSGNYAWTYENSGEQSHSVGGKLPNNWGLYDMHGNAWEWCLSLFKSYPYSETDGRNDPSAAGYRVIRGGSWYRNDPADYRSAFRDSVDPTVFADGYHGYAIGFRCERTP